MRRLSRRTLVIGVGVVLIFTGIFFVTVILRGLSKPDASSAAAIMSQIRPRSYAKTIEHNDALVLRGDEQLVIEDTHYIQRGSIELHDNAKLIIKRSLFEMPNEYAAAWVFTADGDSRFVMEESGFKSGTWINFDFRDRARASYINNRAAQGGGGERGPWQSFADETRLDVVNSYIGGTIWGKSVWRIYNSPGVSIELGIRAPDDVSSTVHAEAIERNLIRDKRVKQWTFPNEGEKHIGYRIDIANSVMAFWGVFVGPNATLTLEKSDRINICLPIHYPYRTETVRLSNLRAKKYRTFDVQFVSTTVRLRDTSTQGWCLNTWEQNQLYVTDSDIDDVNHSGGDSKQFYERIKTNVVVTYGNIEVELRDSVVKGDVVAKDNSTIRLFNTKVEGNVTEEGNGKVIRN